MKVRAFKVVVTQQLFATISQNLIHPIGLPCGTNGMG
jgi:hypothetical protein